MTLMKFILGGKSKYLLFLGLFLMSFTVQSKRIDSISINRTGAIRSVLKEIEKASSYHFMYNDKLINTDKIVSINVKDRPVNEILNSLFEDSNITYTIVDDQIILSVAGTKNTTDSRQSTQPIKGTIKDATTNEPMIGVSVVEKGTTNGTITDIDGAYTLSVKENSTLIFSFLGYKQQSIAIGNRSTIDVLLEEDVHQLSEVVAIGYGSARKQDLSMAVSTIQIDESMKSRPSDFNTLLQGRVSGLTIQSAGGDPLKAGTISIRGRGSRGNDGDPSSGDGILYVVDGVPNAPFNMADVESVTVLKDAASAAIYGASVGSGGVIIITTKQAQAGKAKVSLNIYQGIQNVSKIPDVLSAEQYNQVWARAIADKSPGSSSVLPTVANPQIYPYGNVTRTKWLDEVFRTAYQQHYDLNITGGTDVIKALTSVSYDRNEGILLNTYKESLNAKMNLDFQLTKWMKATQRATFQYTNGQGDVNTSSHQGVLIGSVFYPSSATIYEYSEDGELVYDSYGKPLYGGTIPKWAAATGISGYGEIRNPVATLERLRQNRPSSTIYSTTSIEIKPISRLTIKSDFTAGLRSDRYEYFSSRVPEIGLIIDDNSRGISTSWHTNWVWETTATYAQSFNDKHNISLLGGYTMSKDNDRWTRTVVTDFDKEDEHSTVFPSGNNWTKNKPEETIWDESLISMFGRVGYSFDDKYFATASIRRDATSKLYKDNNSGVFPAFSASWKISSEPFFHGLKQQIDLLKIRGSWGQVGNVKLVPRYSSDVPLSYVQYPLIYGENLDQVYYGVYSSSLSNKNLKWETTEQTGIGLDLTMLKKSLDITVDYFHKTTKDLIEYMAVPSVAGVETAPFGNVGKVVNKGWEFAATYRKTINDINFNIWGNLSSVTSEVKDLGDLPFLQHSTTMNSMQPLRSAVGEPWYSYYLIKTDGIFQNQAEIDNYTKDGKKIQPNAVPGDIKFIDFNNDGTISDNDKQYLGSYLPKITYSFGGGFNMKGFDFSFMFQGISNVEIFNGFKQMGMTGRDVGNNMLADVLNSWNYNPNSGIPRLSIAGDSNGNYSKVSDFFLESGSYLRLKNITLGYTLPVKTMTSLGLAKSSVRFYISGDNLATFTNYSGFDPEVGNFGLDGGNYPVARSFRLGLNVNF